MEGEEHGRQLGRRVPREVAPADMGHLVAQGGRERVALQRRDEAFGKEDQRVPRAQGDRGGDRPRQTNGDVTHVQPEAAPLGNAADGLRQRPLDRRTAQCERAAPSWSSASRGQGE